MIPKQLGSFPNVTGKCLTYQLYYCTESVHLDMHVYPAPRRIMCGEKVPFMSLIFPNTTILLHSWYSCHDFTFIYFNMWESLQLLNVEMASWMCTVYFSRMLVQADLEVHTLNYVHTLSSIKGISYDSTAIWKEKDVLWTMGSWVQFDHFDFVISAFQSPVIFHF